ncbi:MAG: STM4014 family protein [Peptococcaceae bacterium]|nr:STM4014 family protein [Peptococcaceae bacterium]
MSLILLGHPETKRTEYFLKAAHDLGVSVTLIPLPLLTCPHDSEYETHITHASRITNLAPRTIEFDYSSLEDAFVKIDPPPPLSYPIDSRAEDASLSRAGDTRPGLDTVMNRYHTFLLKLQQVPGIRLLNSSDALWHTLDKTLCKQILQKGGLPTTPALTDANGSPARIESLGQLREIMVENSIRQVFIKPRLGSGAAGVAAYRFNPRTGAETMETSALLRDNRLYNTNKLRKTGDSEEIASVINRVLFQGALVEEWIPKASFNGKTFDLRAVYQFGRLEFLVARQSGGAITNLHLNDNALAATDLAFSPSQLSDIETLCRKAVALFPGLNVAGLDILLRQNSYPSTHPLNPLIIEINGQGDLIYQDIFTENRIYQAQIRWLTGSGTFSASRIKCPPQKNPNLRKDQRYDEETQNPALRGHCVESAGGRRRW